MDNPFSDLIPQQGQQIAQGANPFSDLIPAQQTQSAASVPRGNIAQSGFMSYFNAPKDMSPTMADITAFNTGVERLAHGIMQPLLEGSNDELAQASRDVAARREANYKKAQTVDPTGASIAEFVGNAALPMILTRGAGWVTAPATGAAIGAANYVNPGESRLQNAAWGATGGLGGKALGKLFDVGGRKIAEKYAQSAMPGLVERAINKIKTYITPEQAAQSLQANFDEAAEKNDALWKSTFEQAKNLDKSLLTKRTVDQPSSLLDASGNPILKKTTEDVVDFDNSPFKSTINKYLSSVNKLEPAEKAQHENAIGFANYIKDLAPQSFGGAVNLRQNLNQELKKYLERNNIKFGDYQTKQLITSLKSSLKKTVDANAGKFKNSSAFDQFRKTWEAANKSHQELTEFVKTPNPQGVLKPRVPRREALNAGALDAGALGQYLRPSLRSNVGIDQLNKLTGSDAAARSYLMRNVIEGRGNPNAALSAYEKLPLPQRQRLFANRPEGEQLEAASTVRNAFTPKEGGLIPHVLGHLGGMATNVATLGAAPVARKVIAKYATPQSVMRAVNYAKTPNKKAGRYLSPVLASMFASMGENP